MSDQLIEQVISEIENPVFETTKQYLKAHSVELNNDMPQIELIDKESFDEVDIVYVRIKNEPFFLTFHFSKGKFELLGVGTENSNQIYFTATSKTINFNDLSLMTNLKGIKGWSYDQLRPNGKKAYGFSRISYEPIENRAFDFDVKLKKLLTDLESDFEGILKLTKSANAIISVHHQMYISGNKGIHFDRETINRMNHLNLGIDIDQYVYGNEIE